MVGSPLKRQRKLGVRDEDGNLIAFPYMPRVAELPPGWRHWSPAEKVKHLLGMSLDDIYEIMSWPIGELDPFRLSVWMQVTRVVFAIGVKALLDGTLGREAHRERQCEEALERIEAALHARTRGDSDGTGAGG
ncbi:MAG TPA: hypothetical protein VGF39_06810 [Stellaceae bacterium]